MRTFIDGTGADSTAAVRSHLAAHRQLLCADLLQLKTAIQGESWSQNVLLAQSDRPLTWSHIGTFVPGRFRRGEIESKAGLETITMDLDWDLSDADLFFAPSITQLQAFERGLWDAGWINVYRAVMPVPGDCDTFGAMQIFGGRIAEIAQLSRVGVRLKVNSLLELLDLNVPTNLIEPTNVQCEYGIGQPPAGLSALPVFSAVDGSSTSMLLGDCISPNAGQVFDSDIFNFGYIRFVSGTSLGQIFRTVRMSRPYNGHNSFYFYDPLPWLPTAGEQFIAYVPYARNAAGAVYQGFPYVPPPETAT